MSRNPARRRVLAGVVAVLGILTAAILLEVLGTILFAITVAYVLVPAQRWFVRRGLSEWLAAAAATILGLAGAVTVFVPLFVTIYYRLDAVVALVRDLPNELSVTAFGETVVVETADVQAVAGDYLLAIGSAAISALPVLAIKFALFVLLLFALSLKGHAAARAAIAPVPNEYRDIVGALSARARETLYAIYVLQVGTSIATLVAAYSVFAVLGYEAAFTLAMIAAILQFVPIIGPSMLVLPIAGYHVATADLQAAALVAVLGLGLVAWLPDLAVRPRLARRSAGLPGSLYFIGFTGGLFTLGAIGVVIGPLVVAVFVEAVDLLAAEVQEAELDALGDAASLHADTTAGAGGPDAERSESPTGETAVFVAGEEREP